MVINRTGPPPPAEVGIDLAVTATGRQDRMLDRSEPTLRETAPEMGVRVAVLVVVVVMRSVGF